MVDHIRRRKPLVLVQKFCAFLLPSVFTTLAFSGVWLQNEQLLVGMVNLR